jgi:hypothetical protein
MFCICNKVYSSPPGLRLCTSKCYLNKCFEYKVLRESLRESQISESMLTHLTLSISEVATRQTVYVQRNIEARSRNIYISSTILTA